MKKVLSLFILMLLPLVASAEVVEIDGIYYNLISKAKEAEVTNKLNGYYTGSVIIPAIVTYNGVEYSVTIIGDCAFQYCGSLTSITIPNSVTRIGNYAFNGCSGLTSVTIPNSVTSIGNGAFSVCNGLTSITIPSSVTSIESNSFSNCKSLNSVTIPSSVTTIGYSAFFSCSNLTSITIPSSVTSIGYNAFYGCSGLVSITIPNSVTSIQIRTFSGCSGLTSITIPNSVTKIYNQAFAFCKELADVYCLAENIPSTNTDAFEGSYVEYATLHVPAASINDYKTTEPWKNFKNFVTIEEEQLPKCSTPTISFDKDGLVFSCETPEVEYAYEIKDSDISMGFADKGRVSLTPVYTIMVYAMKAGYENSDVATATIRWRNGSPVFQGFTKVDAGAGAVWGDVNIDGVVDVADIANIIDIMSHGSTVINEISNLQ